VSIDPDGLPPDLPGLPAWSPPSRWASTASTCEPYRELIALVLGHGRNAIAIWQDPVDQHGLPARYASVRRFVGKLRGPRTSEAHPVIVTAPREEGQVDYGDGPMVRHPITRKYRRTRLPVLDPLYRDVLAHYGAVALPCRVGHADRKGKIESAGRGCPGS
jgi:hypothetical protein